MTTWAESGFGHGSDVMGRKVVLAFSGGLDTSYCAVSLREQGFEVHTVTVDTGGFTPDERAVIDARARSLGVAEHVTLDARRELFDDFLRYLIFANALRGDVYPLCVSAERVAQARRTAAHALQIGADAIAHGSTGAGNDQVRFDVAYRVMAPQLEILAPIRSQALSREAEVAYLRRRGVEVPVNTGVYSVNRGLWGATIGGGATHASDGELPEDAYEMTAPREQWPRQRQVVVIAFERGVPVGMEDGGDGRDGLDGLNGQDGPAAGSRRHTQSPGIDAGRTPVENRCHTPVSTPVELIERLNEIAGRHGVGRGVHVGDTILGIKGRVAFEAPAAVTLIAAHRELEKLVLTRGQAFWKRTLGDLYGAGIHESRYFDPLMRDLETFLESSQRRVTGRVRVALFQGSASVLGATSPFSLMDAEVARYGEATAMWNGEEAAAFSKLYGLQDTMAARVEGSREQASKGARQ